MVHGFAQGGNRERQRTAFLSARNLPFNIALCFVVFYLGACGRIGFELLDISDATVGDHSSKERDGAEDGGSQMDSDLEPSTNEDADLISSADGDADLISRADADIDPELQVSTPVMNPVGGTYDSDQDITITCDTNDAIIRYTTDGSNPDESSSEYTAPISITGHGTTITVRAIALKDGMIDSEIRTEEYSIQYPSIVSITSTTADGIYGTGSSIDVTVTFREAVTLVGGEIDITLDTEDVVSIAPFGPATSASGVYTVGLNDSTNDLDSTGISLTSGTLRDRQNNVVYIALPSTTIADGSDIIVDGIAPTPGNSGTITASNLRSTALNLSWEKGTDNISAQPALEYRVYRSENNDIDTAANASLNGTLVQDWTPDVAGCYVKGLSADTTHYFNIIVRDERNNESAYAMTNETTSMGAWTRPADLEDHISPEGADAFDPTIAMSNNGGAVIAWIQYVGPNSMVFKSEYRGGSWSHPADLEDHINPGGENAFDPTIIMNNSGDANITWRQYDGSNMMVFKSEYRSGSWFHPADLNDSISLDISGAYVPSAAMDDNDNAIITWYQGNGSNIHIFKSENRGGSWSHPVDANDKISPDGKDAYFPRVAMDNSGNAIIVWRQRDSSNNYQVFKSEYRSGSWTHPTDIDDNISPDGYDVKYPQVAMDNNGNAVIVWYQSDGSVDQVFKSEYRSGSWTHPTDIDDNINPDGDNCYYPQVAMDNNGNTIIVWEQDDGDSTHIFISEYRSGSWTYPASLSDSISPDGKNAFLSTYASQVAMADNGDAVVTWSQLDSSSNRQIYRSVYQGNSWIHPSDVDDNISPDGEDAYDPEVAMDDYGNTIIVWYQSNGSNNQIFISDYR